MKHLPRIILIAILIPAVLAAGGWWFLTRQDGETPKVTEAALQSLKDHGIAPASARLLMVVDFDKPSYAKRGVIYDLVTGEERPVWVAHGAASSQGTEPYATRFSNEMDSNQSSLGLYRIGQVQPSQEHGTKIMLHGLDPKLNGRAEQRGIVIHAPKPGNDYVSFGAIVLHWLQSGWPGVGRSHGCPVLCPDDYQFLKERVSRSGTLNYLYIHHASLTS